MVCPRIHEVVVEMMQTYPASIRRSSLMRVQAPMQHFVGGVRTHEARCVRQTHDQVCQSDRDGRHDQHDQERGGDFFPRGGEVIAFGVVARVFFAERCRAPETSAMTGETMNHVLEKAPGQSSETNCAKKFGDHHGWANEQRSAAGKHNTSHSALQALTDVFSAGRDMFVRAMIAQGSGEFVTQSASMIHIAKMPRSRIERLVGVPTKWNLSLQSMCSVTFVAPQNDSFEVCRRV